MQELDWRAVFFYIALFALVGGLEKTHILDMLADAMKPMFAQNYALGATLLYWVTIPIVGLVEHDAYILTFLYTIKDLGTQGVPSPGRCGGWCCGPERSAATSRSRARRRSTSRCASPRRRRTARSRCASSCPGACRSRLVSSLVCYVLGMLIWVLPYAN